MSLDNEQKTKEENDVKILEHKEAITQQEERQEVDIQDPEERKYEIASQQPKKHKKAIIISIVVAIFVMLLLLFSIIFALINVNNKNIMSGISIKGIEVAGFTKEEATKKIQAILDEKLSKNIILKYDNFETSLLPEQIEATFDVKKAVEEAYEVGRTGNIITNNYSILYAMIVKKNIEVAINVNEESLNAFVKDTGSKIPGAVVESSYYTEDNNLIITKGKPGLIIKQDNLKKDIYKQLGNISTKESVIKIETINKNPDPIDIEKIHAEVYKEPKDAYVTKEPFALYTHVDGVDFAISIEEAQAMLAEEKEEYTIPLKITSPNITTNKLGAEAFPHILSSFSTKYDASNKNRTTNLQLSAGKINGTVVMPGETFSYNKVVGERTIAAGYKEAAVYENGKVVDGLGGGICQISSTLYDAVIYANLEITDRSNHRFLTSYVTAGKDATVVYGAIDFKFKNTRKYPIKLVCQVSNGVAKIEVFGIKEDVEYDVEIQTKVLESIPYTVQYMEDNTLDAGQQIIKQKGANGCKSETYKVLKLNGQVVSKTLLSKDTYSAMQRLIVKGTKGSQGIETNVPKETEQDSTLKNEIKDQLEDNITITENTTP